MEPTAHTTDPVERVTVKLGDKVYPIKFRLSDMSNLAKVHHIDLFIPAEVKGIEAVERVATILSAGIAHCQDALTPEQIMECIELSELPVYALAIAEAQKKASPESVRASKTLAAMVPKKPTRTPLVDEDETIQ